jgi:hypothetical protein
VVAAVLVVEAVVEESSPTDKHKQQPELISDFAGLVLL